MKRLIIGLYVGAVISTPMLVAKSRVLTIDRAVEVALKHNPTIDIGKLDFQAATSRNRFQRGYYLPNINLSSSMGKQGLEFEGQDAISGNLLMGNISASQLLYDFGKTKGRVEASDSQAKAYRADMNHIISSTILSVKVRFYDALKMKSIIDVNKKNIKLQEAQLLRAQRYYDSGIKTIIDVSDAKVRLTKARLSLNDAQYELKLRKALLEESMGFVPNGGDYTLKYEDLQLSKISQKLPKINTTLAWLEGFAYDHRYELQSSKYLIESSRYLVESKKGDYYPTLSANGNYMAQDLDSQFATTTPNRQWQATIDVKWNLFSGLQTDASVEEAKIKHMKASSHLNEIRLQIKREVIESTLYVKRMRDSVILSESIANASEAKFLQAQKRYENDLADYIELQEAQQGYIKSLGDLVVAYYDYYISIAKLDYAVGR
ncbi:type I secretion outer membrane protein [hydrothermal vent metagenome]|uniref:Type I secretion outer membrane protein n=1 Tax=hydrothermal vent metagenome TaxID=652676 RepID=A0A1W1CG16_9ZZZZ